MIMTINGRRLKSFTRCEDGCYMVIFENDGKLPHNAFMLEKDFLNKVKFIEENIVTEKEIAYAILKLIFQNIELCGVEFKDVGPVTREIIVRNLSILEG